MLHYNANKLLNAYLDGELSPEVARQVEKHLESCRRCQKELDEFRRLNKAIQSLPSENAPDPSFLAQQRLKVLERIRNNQTPESSRSRMTQYPLRWSLAGSTFIVLLLVLVLQGKNIPNIFKQSQQILSRPESAPAAAKGMVTTQSMDLSSTTNNTVTSSTSATSYDKANEDAIRRSRELALDIKNLDFDSTSKPESPTTTSSDIQPSPAGGIPYAKGVFKMSPTQGIDIVPQESKSKIAPSAAAPQPAREEEITLELQKDGTIRETTDKKLADVDRQKETLKASSPVLARKAESIPSTQGQTYREIWTPEYYTFDFKNLDLKECLSTIATTARIEIVAIAPKEDIKINFQSRKLLLEKILGNIKQQTNLPFVTNIGRTFYLTKYPLSYYTQRSGYATSKNLVYVLPETKMAIVGGYALYQGVERDLCPHCRKIHIQPDWTYCPLDGTKLKDNE